MAGETDDIRRKQNLPIQQPRTPSPRMESLKNIAVVGLGSLACVAALYYA